MQNLLRNSTSKKVIVISMAIILIALTLFGSSVAIYTSVNKAKRVVSTKDSEGELFSSNYLSLTATASISDPEYHIPGSTISINSDSVSSATYVTICNHAQNSRTRWSAEKIAYDITFTLEGENAATDYSLYNINGVTMTGTSVTFSGQELAGDKAHQDLYTISSSDPNISNKKMRITASTNQNTEAFAQHSLDGRLSFNQYTVESFSWNGSFTEYENHDDASTIEYAGFNYTITGKGEGMVELSWNNQKLDISPISLMQLGNPTKTVNGDVTSVRFNVTMDFDGYQIQFYRVEKAATDETWAQVNTYVEIEVKE